MKIKKNIFNDTLKKEKRGRGGGKNIPKFF